MRFACKAGSRVNFTFDTITPVHELVIVIPELYLPRELRRASRDGATFEHVPGIESVARFGARSQLAAGWRGWVLAYIDRTDLAGIAPACIAAALDRDPGTSARGTHARAFRPAWAAAPHRGRAGDPRSRLCRHLRLLRSDARTAALRGVSPQHPRGSAACHGG